MTWFRGWSRTGVIAQPAVLALVFIFISSAHSTRLLAQTSTRTPKKVLIVYSFDNNEAVYTAFDRALREQIRLRTRDRVEFYTEYLDLIRFPATPHAQDVVKLLELKYSRQKPDLIIPVSYAALDFLLNEGKDLFAGIPKVALFNHRRMDDLQQRLAKSPGENLTAVATTDDAAGSLDLALKLQPETQHVAVVAGSSPVDKYWLDQLKKDLSPYAEKVEILYLADLSLDQLLDRTSHLPPHSIILSTFFFQDSTGQFFLPEEVLDRISREAHVPIYSIYVSYIGHGVVGGRMTDSENTGRKVADLAVAVLNGENARSIPIVLDSSPANTVDWRQLQRWGISENRVPTATVELFREPSAWERYHRSILAIASLCILEALLIVALVLNIQRRRRAETALLREKTLADAVIEGLPGVFLLQDESGKNLRWNKNASVVSRYPPDQVSTLGNVAEWHRGAAQEVRRQLLQQGSGRIEVDLLLRNGRTAPFYFTGVRVDLEGKPHIAVIGLDLTDRKQAEEALRRSELEIRSLVENAPYGIATISVKQDRFLHANPAMVRLLGYKSEPEVLALVVSRDLSPGGESLAFRAQPTRADFFSAIEFNWKRKDGRPVIVRASGRRIRSTNDQGDLLEIIAEDVTARRSLEEQLRQAQKLEALGQLSGSVAHDFNNLISVIIGYSELLSVNPSSDGPMRTHLETIKRAAERAASLTSQLLAFSRRQVLQPSVVNLNSLVRETQKMLQRVMREDVEHTTVLEPSLWKTKADPNQIVQVIMNLAINARDAMPRGGTLTIETANVSFADAATVNGVDLAAGNYVKLAVRDTGIGMDAQTRPRVFEPFFTTKEAGKGTGLGLATVYGIVKQSGGYIFVDSEVGKGTTFSIYLPQFVQAAEDHSPQMGPADAQAKTRSSSETLLVAEDETAFRALLRDGLQARGYQVLAAANGVEALRIAEQHNGPIRLLITDVIMPQMSGPELARALRVTRDIPVLYISGYTDEKFRDMSESGELTLMRKPFYIDELARKIEELLGPKQSDAKRRTSF